jgi:hypothetical protein
VRKIEKVAIGVGVSVVVVGLGVLFLFAVVSGGRGHRSDDEMVLYFKEHEQQFEELLQLYQADAILERYLSLMRELNVEDLMRYSDSEVLFTMSSRGFVGGGSSKGYTYSTEPPTPLVESTEETTVGPYGVVYRHIEDGWYLTYQWN